MAASGEPRRREVGLRGGGRREERRREAGRRRGEDVARRRGRGGEGGGRTLEQILGYHPQAWSAVEDEALPLLRCRRRRRRGVRSLGAYVLPLVQDVEDGGVAVGPLHLLRRRAALRVPVGAAVVAPADFQSARR